MAAPTSLPEFDAIAAALDTVQGVINANAAMLGEEPALTAGALPNGDIALFVGDIVHPAKVLGSPEHAVFIAQRAFLRCAEKVNGHGSH